MPLAYFLYFYHWHPVRLFRCGTLMILQQVENSRMFGPGGTRWAVKAHHMVTKCSPYDNVRTPDIFRSFLARVRSINACPVTMSERRRAADELKTSAFIASNEIVVATQLRIRYHTADELVLYSRRTLLALETNVFRAGVWRWTRWNAHSNFSHGHTAIYQLFPNRTSVEMIAPNSQVSSPPKTDGIALSYSPRVRYCTADIHKIYLCNSVLCWTKRFSSRPG